MPLLNTKNRGVSNTNDISKELQPLKREIMKLNSSIVDLKGQIKTLKAKQELDDELRTQLSGIISYTDKKRVNSCIKDLTNIKKQINMSKTSKIFKEITSIKERLDNIEESFVSDDE